MPLSTQWQHHIVGSFFLFYIYKGQDSRLALLGKWMQPNTGKTFEKVAQNFRLIQSFIFGQDHNPERVAGAAAEWSISSKSWKPWTFSFHFVCYSNACSILQHWQKCTKKKANVYENKKSAVLFVYLSLKNKHCLCSHRTNVPFSMSTFHYICIFLHAGLVILYTFFVEWSPEKKTTQQAAGQPSSCGGQSLCRHQQTLQQPRQQARNCKTPEGTL